MEKIEEILSSTTKALDNCSNITDATNIINCSLVDMLAIHSKVIACFCECLAFNAQNCQATMLNTQVPYSDVAYISTMQKWGIVDEKGESLI